MNKKKILIVEDEQVIALNEQALLEKKGYEIAGISPSGEDAIELVEKTKPDIVLMDIILSGKLDGIETYKKIREKHDIPIIYITAYSDEKTLQRAKATEPKGYIIKNFQNEELYTSIEIALYNHNIDKKLRESEEKYRLLAENTSDSIWIMDIATLKFIYNNPNIEKLLGYTPDEIYNLTINDIVTENSLNAAIKILADELALDNEADSIKERTQTIELEQIHKDGHIVWLEAITKFLRDEDGKPVKVLGVSRDITERKKAEEALRKSREQYRQLLESITDGIAVLNEKLELLIINDAASAYIKADKDEITGKKITDLYPNLNGTQFIKKIENVIKNKNAGSVTDIYSFEDGSEGWFEVRVYPVPEGVLCIISDITEKITTERELIKASKIESLGIISGGIAHDFNNLLTAIVGNISFAKLNLPENDKIHQILSEAEKASIRAKDLTQQLLTFSRGGVPIKKTISVRELLYEVIEFVLSGSNVSCQYSISDDLLNIEADEGQISQVIHNLALNARQAMSKGGSINVKAQNKIIKSPDKLPVANGNYIEIIFSDEGGGIEEENIDKIFDPYFTTKEQGSGLGLSISYSILKRHDGHISAHSESGKGSTFILYLPSTDKPLETDISIPDKTPFRGGKILLMDDESMVLKTGQRMLESLGFTVNCVKSGEEAIDSYKKEHANGHPFDLVIMDLTIPGKLGGKETIKKLKEFDPEIKAIVSSGYSNDPVMGNFRKYGFHGIMTKPYRFDDLFDVLHSVLDQ